MGKEGFVDVVFSRLGVDFDEDGRGGEGGAVYVGQWAGQEN